MTRSHLLALFFALFAACIGIYFTDIGGQYHTFILNFIFLLPPLLAVAGGIGAVREYGIKNMHGRALLYITLGLAAWFIGETLFAVYDVVLHIDPYPSIADAFYLLAYPLILVGIFKEIFNYKTDMNPIRSIVISIVSIILSILVFALSIQPSYSSGASALENLIAMSYGVGDLILIVGVSHILMLTMDFQGGKLYRAWTYVIVAVCFMLLGDMLYAIYTQQYNDNNPLFKRIDLLWIVSYLAFAYGLFELKFIIRDVQDRVGSLLT